MPGSPESVIMKKTSIVLLVAGIVVLFLYSVRVVVLPFFLSAVLSYFISPLVVYFESFGIKRGIVVVSIYIFFMTICLSAIVTFSPKIMRELSKLSSNLQVYAEGLKGSLGTLQHVIETKYPIVRQKGIFDTIVKKISGFVESEISQIPTLLLELFPVLSLLVLIPVITFFMLMNGRKVFNAIFRAVPSRYVETVLSIVCEFDVIVGRFVRGQIIEAVCVAVMSVAGLLFLNIEYAVIIGIVAGLANMIPYMGPVAGAVPAIISAITFHQDSTIVIKVVLLFVIIQFIDNNFIQPIVVSKGMKIHPAVIIFVVLAGAQMGGVIGMFLAVPVASMIKTSVLILYRKATLI